MSKEKRQVPTGKTQKTSDTPPRRVVLVGTYKGDQLSRWRGWYCWPLDEEESRAKAAKNISHRGTEAQRGATCDTPTECPQGGASRPGEPFAHVTELWLFKGTAEQRNYRAEFVGVKTREELIRDYGYPAKGKAHGDKYALFKPAQEVA